MSTNTVILNLKGTSDLSKITTDMRKLGTESKTTATSIKQATTQLEQTNRSTQTFGQKLRGFGSRFGGLSTNVAGLGSSVVNLNRQYQDLSDTQIRVDRSTLKLSKSNEAVKTAQGKLAAAVKKYGANSKQAQQATLDLNQAMEAQKLATTLLGEAQEDQQRAYEDFWLGIGPTVSSAAGTIIGVIKDLIGKKGFGGIAEAAATASTAIGIGGGKGGGGGSGFLGTLSKIGPSVAGITAGGVGAFGIMGLLKPIQDKLDTATGVTEADRTPPLLIPFIGDEKTRKQAIKKYEADLTYLMDAKRITGMDYTGFDAIGDGIKNLFGQKTKMDEITAKMVAAGRATGQLKVEIEGAADPTEGLGASIGGLSGHVAEATVSVNGLNAAFTGGGTAGGGTAGGTANSMTYFATLMDTIGKEAQFLDASLQPLGAGVDQLATSLGKAQDSLTKSGSGLSVYQQNLNTANQTLDQYRASVDAAQVADSVMRAGLTADIESMTGMQIATSYTTSELKMLYEAAKLGGKYFNEVKKGLDAIASAAATAGANAEAMSYALQGIPRGKKITYHGPGGAPVYGQTGPRAIASGTPGYGFSYSPQPSSYFQKLRKKTGGSTPAWEAKHPKKKKSKHQHGFAGLVTGPTWMLAGEAGPEAVDIAPLRGGRRRGPSGGFGGGGGGSGPCFNIYIGGKRIMEDIRYSINDNAGVMK